jgi:hypothetical protein
MDDYPIEYNIAIDAEAEHRRVNTTREIDETYRLHGLKQPSLYDKYTMFDIMYMLVVLSRRCFCYVCDGQELKAIEFFASLIPHDFVDEQGCNIMWLAELSSHYIYTHGSEYACAYIDAISKNCSTIDIDHWCHFGYVDIIHVLLENGADISSKKNDVYSFTKLFTRPVVVKDLIYKHLSYEMACVWLNKLSMSNIHSILRTHTGRKKKVAIV